MKRIVLSLCLVAVLALGSSSWAALSITGYIGNKTNSSGTAVIDPGGINATGNSWSGTGNDKRNKGVGLAWSVVQADNVYTYSYTFSENTGALKDINSFVLGVASNFTSGDLISASITGVTGATGATLLSPIFSSSTPTSYTINTGSLAADPINTLSLFGLQALFPGEKTLAGPGQSEFGFTFTIQTTFAPVWGDFFVGGGEVTGTEYISAFNSNFGQSKSLLPSFTDGSYYAGLGVATPGAPVPIPPAVFLFGSGLSGLFFFRRKKFTA